MIKPIDYKQTDSRWGGLKYAVDGESSTIKSAGCGITVMADILATLVSPYITPVTTASSVFSTFCFNLFTLSASHSSTTPSLSVRTI